MSIINLIVKKSVLTETESDNIGFFKKNVFQELEFSFQQKHAQRCNY